MKTTLFAQFAAISICLVAAIAASAQSIHRNVGNGNASISVSPKAKAVAGGLAAIASTELRASGHFLTGSGEFYSLLAKGAIFFGDVEGSLNVRIGGNDVLTTVFTEEQRQQPSVTRDVFPGDVSEVFWLGSVPVTVKGNVQVTAKTNLLYSFNDSRRVGGVALDGTSSCIATGRVSAVAGIPGFSAPTVADLRFGKAAFSGKAEASYTGANLGELRYSLSAIRLFIAVQARRYWFLRTLILVDVRDAGVPERPFL